MIATNKKSQSGFTLIEVLIALSITAIAAVISYSGLDSAIRLAESSELEADRLQKMNRVFDILSQDFHHIAPRIVRSPDGGSLEHALQFEDMSHPYLRFSRNGWTNIQPERFQRSQLQRVNYHLDGDKLMRYSWQMMDRYNDSEMQEIMLLDHVKSFQVRAMEQDLQQATGGGMPDLSKTKWSDAWPKPGDVMMTISDALPYALEVTIELEGWGKIRRVYEMVENQPL